MKGEGRNVAEGECRGQGHYVKCNAMLQKSEGTEVRIHSVSINIQEYVTVSYPCTLVSSGISSPTTLIELFTADATYETRWCATVVAANVVVIWEISS